MYNGYFWLKLKNINYLHYNYNYNYLGYRIKNIVKFALCLKNKQNVRYKYPISKTINVNRHSI